MNAATACSLGVAMLVVAINLNYSLLSALVYRLREQHWPDRLPLGIPMLGTLAAAAAWIGVPEGHSLRPLLLVLAMLDTGGPLAWLVWTLRRRRHAPRELAVPRAAALALRKRTLG